MKKLKVYIASPYTNGNTANNVRRSLDALHVLFENGFVPFSPLLNHYAEIHKHKSEEDWFNWDLEWLRMCDVLVRIRPIIDGKEIPSPGSDIEQKEAKKLNLLVFDFNTIEELKKWAKNADKEELIEFTKINLPSR